MFREHYALRRKFEWCSPALTITKNVRMYVTKKRYQRKRRVMKILYFMMNRWRKRVQLIKLRTKLGFGPKELDTLRRIGAKRRIWNAWLEYKRCKRIKLFVALRLQSNYRMICAQNSTYTRFLGLQAPKQNRKNKKPVRRMTTVDINPDDKRKLSRQASFRSPKNDVKILLQKKEIPRLIFTRKQIGICESIGIS